MLAVLNQHCRPDSVANAFTTLMSLFNDVQSDSKSILEFCSCFDGSVMDMPRCKVIIPPLLLVMIFLCVLHSRYSDILDQFRSRYKVLEDATIESVVVDVEYHDSFQLVDSDNKHPGSRGPPFEWLSSYNPGGIKTRWTRAVVGTGICPICHREEKPWHVPANCPLLKELNLKLVSGPPSPSPAPAPGGPPAPAPAASAAPSPSPSPGGRVALADTPLLCSFRSHGHC